MDTKRPPAERLVKFEVWLRRELAARLEWPADPVVRQRQIGQCQKFVNGFLCDLNRRGWLFDGPILARIITDKLDCIAKYQKSASIENLWIYLQSIWSNYADAAAEKLQADAMSLGFHVSQIMAGLKTIPQATAERAGQITAEKLTKERKRQERERIEANQTKLF